MCMYKGGDWAGSQKAGWVHCVTAHVHSPPSIPASLCMFYFFFPSLRSEIVEICRPNTFGKYRLADCGSVHLNSHSRCLCVPLKCNVDYVGAIKKKGKRKKEQYIDNNAVKTAPQSEMESWFCRFSMNRSKTDLIIGLVCHYLYRHRVWVWSEGTQQWRLNNI